MTAGKAELQAWLEHPAARACTCVRAAGSPSARLRRRVPSAARSTVAAMYSIEPIREAAPLLDARMTEPR
jgi:hypothetical protein